MRAIEYTIAALIDLAHIEIDGAERFGPAQTARLQQEIRERVRALADMPTLGRHPAPEKPGYDVTSLPRPLRLLYRFCDDMLTIIRGIHRRQDFDAILRRS